MSKRTLTITSPPLKTPNHSIVLALLYPTVTPNKFPPAKESKCGLLKLRLDI